MTVPADSSTRNSNFTLLSIGISENKELLSLSYVCCPMKMVSECKSYKWEWSFPCPSDIILSTAEYMWEHGQVICEVFYM
jgi:hypothetical protein